MTALPGKAMMDMIGAGRAVTELETGTGIEVKYVDKDFRNGKRPPCEEGHE